MSVLIIILLVLALILLLPAGIDAAIDNSGVCIKIKLGPVCFRLPSLSGKAKPRRETKARKTPDTDSSENEKHEKAHGKLSLSELPSLIGMGFRALGRLRRHLYIELLELQLVCGGADPYSTAMSYGYISAAVGMLLPLAEKSLNIGRKNISVDVDFDIGAFIYKGRLVLTIQIWQAFHIAFAFLYEYAAYKIKRRKQLRAQERNDSNGESDKRTYERDDDQSQKHGGREHYRRRTDSIS